MTTWLDDLLERDRRLDDTYDEESADLGEVYDGRPEWAVTDLARIEDLKQQVFGTS